MNVAPPRPWQEADGGWHIDVRGLQPPQPLVAVARLLETLGMDGANGAKGATVTARFDRNPVMLYPELARLGWVAERSDGAAGDVQLRLTRRG